MAEQPNDASRKSKAEGDRTDERSGITNRTMEEESSSQQSVPPRGQEKCGPPRDSDMDLDQDLEVESRRGER